MHASVFPLPRLPAVFTISPPLLPNRFARTSPSPGNRPSSFTGASAVASAIKRCRKFTGDEAPARLHSASSSSLPPPIDGHDTATLIKTFEFLKKQDRPVLLHVLTQKGRGFEPAMQKQKKFHGLG